MTRVRAWYGEHLLAYEIALVWSVPFLVAYCWHHLEIPWHQKIPVIAGMVGRLLWWFAWRAWR